MTMIHGAIVWLTDRRARIDQAIEILQRLVEEAAVTPAPQPTPRPRQKANGTPVKTKAATTPAAPQRPQTGSTAHAVAQLLKRAGPLSPREIRQAADMSSSEVWHALKVLSTRKLVTATGSTNDWRYQVASNFDVVWNGTKDRNGDAPSLVGDRVTRSAS